MADQRHEQHVTMKTKVWMNTIELQLAFLGYADVKLPVTQFSLSQNRDAACIFIESGTVTVHRKFMRIP